MPGPEPVPQGVPPEGGATPDDAMASQEAQRIAQMEAIAAAAPQPEKPYSSNVVVKFVDSMNNMVEEVDPDMAAIEYTPEGTRIDGPLPPEVFVPFVIIMSFLQTMEGMEKYIMDPSTLVNDAALRKATAQINMLTKDTDAIEQMKAPPTEGEEAPEEAEEAPEEVEESPEAAGAMPDDMEDEDEALMARM
jgi:hypothetical protein